MDNSAVVIDCNRHSRKSIRKSACINTIAQPCDLPFPLAVPEAERSDPSTKQLHPTSTLIIADLLPELLYGFAVWLNKGIYEALDDEFEHVTEVYCLVAVLAELVEPLEYQLIIGPLALKGNRWYAATYSRAVPKIGLKSA